MSAPSERDVQALAHRIAEAGGEEKTSLFRGSWWSEQLLDWAMAKGAFKTQLFRFVDVFPGCRDDDDVMRHLQEYFEGSATPAPLRLGLGLGAKVPFGAGVSAATARRNIHRMARQFIAGETAAEALPRLEALWLAGEASTGWPWPRRPGPPGPSSRPTPGARWPGSTSRSRPPPWRRAFRRSPGPKGWRRPGRGCGRCCCGPGRCRPPSTSPPS